MSLPIAIHGSAAQPASPSFDLPFSPEIVFSPAAPPVMIAPPVAPASSNALNINIKQYQTDRVRERVERWNKRHEPREKRTISPMRVRIDLFEHQQADGRFTVFVHGDGSKPPTHD